MSQRDSDYESSTISIDTSSSDTDQPIVIYVDDSDDDQQNAQNHSNGCEGLFDPISEPTSDLEEFLQGAQNSAQNQQQEEAEDNNQQEADDEEQPEYSGYNQYTARDDENESDPENLFDYKTPMEEQAIQSWENDFY